MSAEPTTPPATARPAPGTSGDERFKPIVTYTLMGISIAVYVLQMGSQFLLGGDYPLGLGAKVNDLILQGQLWRLITPMLLHGSIYHIGFNMYALAAIGPALERYFGRGRYLILYLLGGFAGNVVSFFFSPAISVGSSTAIFGLFGAQAVFLYRNRELFGERARQALVQIVMLAAINLFIGLSPGIDNWGHVGGLVGGTLYAWLAGPVLLVRQDAYLSPYLTDERETGDTVRGGLVVLAFFTFIALIKFFR